MPDAEVEGAKCNGTEHDSEDSEDDAWHPPFESLPKGIKSPTSLIEHLVMEHCSRYVREEGAELEILLRSELHFRQELPFIQEDHDLHKYFRFLCETGASLEESDPAQLPGGWRFSRKKTLAAEAAGSEQDATAASSETCDLSEQPLSPPSPDQPLSEVSAVSSTDTACTVKVESPIEEQPESAKESCQAKPAEEVQEVEERQELASQAGNGEISRKEDPPSEKDSVEAEIKGIFQAALSPPSEDELPNRGPPEKDPSRSTEMSTEGAKAAALLLADTENDSDGDSEGNEQVNSQSCPPAASRSRSRSPSRQAKDETTKPSSELQLPSASALEPASTPEVVSKPLVKLAPKLIASSSLTWSERVEDLHEENGHKFWNPPDEGQEISELALRIANDVGNLLLHKEGHIVDRCPPPLPERWEKHFPFLAEDTEDTRYFNYVVEAARRARTSSGFVAPQAREVCTEADALLLRVEELIREGEVEPDPKKKKKSKNSVALLPGSDQAALENKKTKRKVATDKAKGKVKDKEKTKKVSREKKKNKPSRSSSSASDREKQAKRQRKERSSSSSSKSSGSSRSRRRGRRRSRSSESRSSSRSMKKRSSSSRSASDHEKDNTTAKADSPGKVEVGGDLMERVRKMLQASGK